MSNLLNGDCETFLIKYTREQKQEEKENCLNYYSLHL